jgi:hypothetical protein
MPTSRLVLAALCWSPAEAWATDKAGRQRNLSEDRNCGVRPKVVGAVQALSTHSLRVRLPQNLFAAGEDGVGVALELLNDRAALLPQTVPRIRLIIYIMLNHANGVREGLCRLPLISG